MLSVRAHMSRGLPEISGVSGTREVQFQGSEEAMALREKYNHAIQTAKNYRMQGGAEEREGKLFFKGTVSTQDEANAIWTAIKTVPTWPTEVVADIKATAATAAPAQQTPTYTVKSGDTLSKIAKEHLGNASAYMEIFNLNRDQLTDPDKIQPGQVLKLPQAVRK